MKVPVDKLYYNSEPDIKVVGGPLYEGYKLCLAGKFADGQLVIVEFLVSVYAKRNEKSTHQFIVVENGVADIRAAAYRRTETYEMPLVRSMIENGYTPEPGHADYICAWERNGLFYVMDGKNRCSILAAMGHKEIEMEVGIEDS